MRRNVISSFLAVSVFLSHLSPAFGLRQAGLDSSKKGRAELASALTAGLEEGQALQPQVLTRHVGPTIVVTTTPKTDRGAVASRPEEIVRVVTEVRREDRVLLERVHPDTDWSRAHDRHFDVADYLGGPGAVPGLSERSVIAGLDRLLSAGLEGTRVQELTAVLLDDTLPWDSRQRQDARVRLQNLFFQVHRGNDRFLILETFLEEIRRWSVGPGLKVPTSRKKISSGPGKDFLGWIAQLREQAIDQVESVFRFSVGSDSERVQRLREGMEALWGMVAESQFDKASPAGQALERLRLALAESPEIAGSAGGTYRSYDGPTTGSLAAPGSAQAGLEQGLERAVGFWSEGPFSTPPYDGAAGRTVFIFRSGTHQAILPVAEHPQFQVVALVESGLEEGRLQTLLGRLGLEHRVEIRPAAALPQVLAEHREDRTIVVDATEHDWFNRLLAGLEALGVLPLGDWNAGLEAVDDYLKGQV